MFGKSHLNFTVKCSDARHAGPSSPNRRLYIHPTYAYVSEVSGLALIFIEPFSHGGTVHEERYLSRQLCDKMEAET